MASKTQKAAPMNRSTGDLPAKLREVVSILSSYKKTQGAR